MPLDDAIGTKLRPREPSPGAGWRVWEHKTLNIHRGLLHWQPGEAVPFRAMAVRIRQQAEALFRVSWWRGFGFGAVLEVPSVPPDLPSIEAAVDGRENPKGTWQWTVLACEPARIAVGVHTWAEGYLTPVYRAVLDGYASRGFEAKPFKKEMDKLLQFLMPLARLRGFRIDEIDG